MENLARKIKRGKLGNEIAGSADYMTSVPPHFTLSGPPDSLALGIPDVVKQGTAWLKHSSKVLVERGAVHIRRLAKGAGRRIVDYGGELAVPKSFNKLFMSWWSPGWFGGDVR